MRAAAAARGALKEEDAAYASMNKRKFSIKLNNLSAASSPSVGSVQFSLMMDDDRSFFGPAHDDQQHAKLRMLLIR